MDIWQIIQVVIGCIQVPTTILFLCWCHKTNKEWREFFEWHERKEKLNEEYGNGSEIKH